MKPRSRILILTAAIALIFVAVFLTRQPPTSFGQQNFPPSSRHPACGCYVCGLLLSVEFPDKAPDCVGILATDACPVEMAKMPVVMSVEALAGRSGLMVVLAAIKCPAAITINSMPMASKMSVIGSCRSDLSCPTLSVSFVPHISRPMIAATTGGGMSVFIHKRLQQ